MQARLWDVETGTSKAAVHGSHQAHACAASRLMPGVAAYGGADDHVHLWDVRTPGLSQTALVRFPAVRFTAVRSALRCQFVRELC